MAAYRVHGGHATENAGGGKKFRQKNAFSGHSAKNHLSHKINGWKETARPTVLKEKSTVGRNG